MKKSRIILLAAITVVVALAAWFISASVLKQEEQAVVPEQEVAEENFEADPSIETGDLGEYGKLINDLELDDLDAEFKEIDGLVGEL
jgi:hypothetical protein